MFGDVDLWEEFSSDTCIGFLIYSYAKWAKAIYHGFKGKGSFRVGQMQQPSVLNRPYTGWK